MLNKVESVIKQATYAIFVTLIVGIVFSETAKVIANQNISEIFSFIGTVAKLMTGPAIGVSVAIVLSKNPIVVYTCAVVGSIACGMFTDMTSLTSGDPLSALFCSTIVALVLDQILKSKVYDLLFGPILGFILTIGCMICYQPLNLLIDYLAQITEQYLFVYPIIVVPLLALLFGLFITGPFSSVLFAILLSISGRGAFVGVCATCAQMMFLGAMGLKDNGIIKSLMVMFGTSKLQFNNLLANRFLLISSLLCSVIVALVGWYMTDFISTTAAAGLGWCMFTGVVVTIVENTPSSAGPILMIVGVLPFVLGLINSFLLKKLKLIKKGSLELK